MSKGQREDRYQASEGQAAALASLDAGLVAAWLQKHPQFFEQHRDMLSQLQLTHPHGGRAISLIERQVAVLREDNRRLEHRMADFLRIGRENDALSMKMQALSHAMLGERDPARLPGILVASLKKGFEVPAVLVRLWAELPLPETSTGPVSTGLQQWADRLEHPYCGPCTMDEIAGWFPDKGQGMASMAVMPLRAGNDMKAFGLLVLASDDPNRFQLGMGTVVLEQLADMAGAALSRALPAEVAASSA
ncbi:MAG: DUF484 family protein [Lautropia sp.]|nr:DUF484 family protein [Lautropia sp.]